MDTVESPRGVDNAQSQKTAQELIASVTNNEIVGTDVNSDGVGHQNQ